MVKWKNLNKYDVFVFLLLFFSCVLFIFILLCYLLLFSFFFVFLFFVFLSVFDITYLPETNIMSVAIAS